MSEIEKMYKNAHIRKCVNIGNFCKHIGATCERCKKHKYPPFTAEKQIELIKWLGLKDDIDYIRYYYKPLTEEWVFEITYLTEFSNEPAFMAISYEYELEEGLASLINLIWQDLTENEKQQIKEILE